MAENEGRQFRILYRDFLTRILDLELLSSRGEIERLQAQFGALLAAFSLVFAVYYVPRYALATAPYETLIKFMSIDMDLLISTTMAVAGLFTVLAWNTVLPDRRDCLILGLLPVRQRVIFFAKVAALAVTLGLSIVAINAFTGLAYPFLLAPQNASLPVLLRPFAAYWITMISAGLFVCCSLLGIQGLTAHLLPHRLFLKLSSFLQLAAFFVILGAFFLKPPFPITGAAPSWMPSFWFLGLYRELSGGGTAAFHALAGRALLGLAVAAPTAAFTFALAFYRQTRRIVEQPDIVPSDRRRPASRIARSFAALLSRKQLDRAILLFTARTIARSRHHRLLLAAYGGIGLAVALAYARDLLYGSSSLDPFWRNPHWDQPNAPLLVGSFILLFFAVVATRAVFAMPIALSANWIFRITAVHSPAAYCSAVRKCLLALSVFPVWCGWALLYLSIWPVRPALQHLAILALSAFLMTQIALHGFRKIPFACSYLPGKSNLHVRIGLFGLGFLFISTLVVGLELWTFRNVTAYVVVFSVLLLATIGAYRRTAAFPVSQLLFEDQPPVDVEALDLHSDSSGSSGSYLDSDRSGVTPFRSPSRRFITLASAPPEIPAAPFSWEQLLRDLLGGARVLTRAPGFSAAAIVLIALGLGWNTTIYSMVHAILSKPAPGIAADGMVSFGVTMDGRHADPGENSFAEYMAYASNSSTMLSIAGFKPERFAMVLPDGSSYRLRGTMVTGNYFDTLRVRLAQGRTFTEDEARGAAPLAAIITDSVWQMLFHGAFDVLGKTVLLNGRQATIVGIGPPHFHGTSIAPNLEICVPLVAYTRVRGTAPDLEDPRIHGVGMIGRLQEGVSMSSAQAEFDHLAGLFESAHPEVEPGKRPLLAPYSATAFGPNSGPQMRLFLSIVMGVAILTLLIVCANVANLALARSMARQREMAIRLSMGAPASRLMRMLFCEGLTLALCAAAAAWLFTGWATRAIVSLLPPLESGGRFDVDLTPDWRVAAYAIALALLSTMAFTIAPALRAWRQDLLPPLKGGENGVIGGRSKLARTLVIAQLALSVVLLTGGGLAVRSLSLIDTKDLGFRKDHVLLAAVNTAGASETPPVLLERLRGRLRALPGVASVSWAVGAPPNSHGWMGIAVHHTGSAESVPADGTFAGPDYLATLGVRIVAGRDFSHDDMLSAQTPVVVNRKLANALWPRQSALGRTITLGQGTIPLVVIGVAADATLNGVGEDGSFSGLSESERRPFVFLADQQGAQERTFHIRYSGNPASLATAVRAAIRQVDSRLTVFSVRSLESDWRDFTAPIRALVTLLSFFAIGSLTLATAGLYAVTAFETSRRTREFGIRMALGATPRQTVQSVVREALWMAVGGLGIGVAVCFGASQALAHVLFGVRLSDPFTYLTAGGLLLLVSFVASYMPARRASRIDPMSSLRQE